MVKRILVLYDGSDVSIKSLSYVLSFIDTGDHLELIYIVERDVYENIREGIEKTGGEAGDIKKVLDDLELKFRKQVRGFIELCKTASSQVKCIFRIGGVAEEIIKETTETDYDMVVIPYSKTFEERMESILRKIITGFKGNILIVK